MFDKGREEKKRLICCGLDVMEIVNAGTTTSGPISRLVHNFLLVIVYLHLRRHIVQSVDSFATHLIPAADQWIIVDDYSTSSYH